ncbi:MAG: hypothetical protein ACLGIT_03225 [Gammaproteobacteria bacterium]|uniref:hypothetical protein n=1 Tax=Azohydromonas sp. TaxID=1872666 RepID=UPI002BD2C2EF|nr:hypothetical protein [Azohydromonas sp.]HMM85969.1 hypothetical protein [Azohydromonas sp.]
MHSPSVASDPFALMLNPQSVVQAMEASERLRRLHRRVCRPLDKVAGVEPIAPAGPVWADDGDASPMHQPS